MKIVHIIEYFQPKLGYQEFFLAKEQTKQGHDVTVITSDRFDPLLFQGDAVKPILGDRIQKPGCYIERGVQVLRLKPLFEIAPIGLWLLGLEKKLKEINPDLIHIHGIASISAIRIGFFKLFNHKNKYLTFDDHMVFSASRSKTKFLYFIFRLLFSKILIKVSNKLVAVQITSIQFMHKIYGIPLDLIEYIPLGVDIDLFQFDQNKREEIRKKLDILDDEVLFIYAGKIVPPKGPDLIIYAANILRKTHNNFKILLLGNGPKDYTNFIKKQIDFFGLKKYFIFHEPVPNLILPAFYCASDVAIWPMEASLSMLEAMACGLPIIISDKSEVNERVEYNSGFTFEHKNIEDLAYKMKLLMNTPLRQQMGHNAIKYVRMNFSWKLISDRFLCR